MKSGFSLLPVLVAWLIVPIIGSFHGLDPGRAPRPQERPTALRVTESFLQVKPHQISSDGAENDHASAHDVLSSKLDGAGPEGSGHTAAELTGVKPNQHGHLLTTSISLGINLCIVLVCMLGFSALRLRFPLIYSGNVVFSKIAPMTPDETFLGWLSASVSLSTEEIAESMGLDAALMVEFCNISCKILAIIGVPMVCIMCPLHYFFGGRGTGIDDLSSITMGNVVYAHRWLYYVHALIINLVTIIVIHVIYSSMPSFLRLRYKWLKEMSAPRSVTVLVEGIPKGWRSDAKLKEFFSTMFKPELISQCFVVKDAPHLHALFNEQQQYAELLKCFKEQWQASSYRPEERPLMHETMCVGDQIDAIEYVEKKLVELRPQVDEARAAALKEAEAEGGINCSSGFVTFSRRREVEVCHNIQAFSSHRDEWVISHPPPASDVCWVSLTVPETRKKVLSVIGYGCTWTLFIMFIPIVVFGTNVTHAIRLDFLEPIWSRFAPGLALMLFLAFLPTVLLLIFHSFFSLKSETFAQHKLQMWYFLFMAFFVLLVTVVGKSLVETIGHVVERPGSVMELLAKQMPTATYFYMDLLMLQWGEQAINFLRGVPLAKFLFFKSIYEEDDAKRMAEPEDQDFYGIGSRSARFTIMLLIGIIFSTLSPLIALNALMLFGLMRVFYGYLIVFAETKKPDLGGVFFNTQLQHLIGGLGIYNILMAGVLHFRTGDGTPMLLSLPPLAYTVWSYWHFSHNFVWSELPFSEVCYQNKTPEAAEDSESSYVQPEFAETRSTEVASAFQSIDEQSAWHSKLFNGVAGPLLERYNNLRSPPSSPDTSRNTGSPA